MKPVSPALAGGFFTSEPPENHHRFLSWTFSQFCGVDSVIFIIHNPEVLSLNRYFLSAYDMPGTIQSSRDASVSKTKTSALSELTSVQLRASTVTLSLKVFSKCSYEWRIEIREGRGGGGERRKGCPRRVPLPRDSQIGCSPSWAEAELDSLTSAGSTPTSLDVAGSLRIKPGYRGNEICSLLCWKGFG